MKSFSRDRIALCDNIGRDRLPWEQLCRKDLGSDKQVEESDYSPLHSILKLHMEYYDQFLFPLYKRDNDKLEGTQQMTSWHSSP